MGLLSIGIPNVTKIGARFCFEMTAQYFRNRSTETPSERKNRQLFENAGSGLRASSICANPRFYPIPGTCSECRNWPECEKLLGPSSGKSKVCERPSVGWKK